MFKSKRILTLLSAILIVMIAIGGCGKEGSSQDPVKYREVVAKDLYQQIEDNDRTSYLSDWVVFDIKKSGIETDSTFYEEYFDNLRARLKQKQGILTEDNYTDYARVSIVTKAIGKNPENVDGYNLLEPLDDYDKITKQGVNAAIYALIAANYSGYKLQNEEAYKAFILKELGEDGDLSGDMAEVDYIGMAMQALAYYKDEPQVKAFFAESLKKLKTVQKDDGSFGNLESTAQVVMGLAAFGKDPEKTLVNEKTDKSLIDGIMKYAKGKSFVHVKGMKEGGIAGEQGLMALNAYALFKEKKQLMPKAN